MYAIRSYYEGIALWGELRQIATVDEMVERALAYLRRYRLENRSTDLASS